MRLDWEKLLFMDFEAQSEVSIVKVGAHVYAEHPSTVALCCAWALGDGPVQLWIEGEPVPQVWKEALLLGLTGVAHNKDTEENLLRRKFRIVIDEWIDTATVASQAGLPRALDEVCAALGLPPTGDTSAMMQIARPRKASKDNPDKFWRPDTRPDLFRRLYDYCKIDTERTRDILRKLPPYHWLVSPKERKLELLTDKMNARGVKVDLTGIELAKLEVEAHTVKLKQEFMGILPGVNPKSPIVAAKALDLPCVDKETVRDALKAQGLLPDRKRALEILKTLNTAAVRKLDAFESRTTQDDRLHGAMVYCGAGRTWRWSSMGVQLHNLIRGLSSGNIDWPAVDKHKQATKTAFEALFAGLLSVSYENPTRVVAAMMKGFLLGPFLMGDFSQIEPRVQAMLAGQKSMLDAFRAKIDSYKILASKIYNTPIDKINDDQRFMGKQGVLGCGYGLGWMGFISMLKTIYDVNVSEQDAKRVVTAYRQLNPDIVKFWYNLENLVKQCVLEQWQEFHTGPKCPGLAARMYKSWLVIRLPDGGCLWYFEPSLIPGEYGLELHYWGRNPKLGGRWMRVKTYGGKLAENVTQAIARRIMGDAMLRLEAHGYTVNLTVHDEIVCEEQECNTLEEFESLMKVPPDWMPSIPLDVECKRAERYQK